MLQRLANPVREPRALTPALAPRPGTRASVTPLGTWRRRQTGGSTPNKVMMSWWTVDRVDMPDSMPGSSPRGVNGLIVRTQVGSCTRMSNRPKSRSNVTTVAPCSIARAAMWASVVRLPAVPACSSSPRSTDE
jgi:hypothetical protein